MLMRSKNLLKIKKLFRDILEDKNIIDIIVFGSAVKGKALPQDIDIALIYKNKINKNKIPREKNLHISFISVEEFFRGLPLTNILLREGISLKYKKPLAEIFRFKNMVLFAYSLEGLRSSKKVKIVNWLKNKKTGITKYGGVWVRRSVFFVPCVYEKIFADFFIKNKVKFKKWYSLIH